MKNETVLNSESISTISNMFNSLLELATTTDSIHYEYLVAKANEFIDWCCEEVDMEINDDM